MFMDADMLCLGDIAELFHVAPSTAVCVAPVTRQFERSSLMFFNNFSCKALTPEFIETHTPQVLEEWAPHVGSLPKEWNHTVPYDGENPNAKIVHYTQGIPCFNETSSCEYAKEWGDEFSAMISTCGWEDLMGNSVHKKEMQS